MRHGRNTHGEHGTEAVLFCVLRVLLSVAKAIIAGQQKLLNIYDTTNIVTGTNYPKITSFIEFDGILYLNCQASDSVHF